VKKVEKEINGVFVLILCGILVCSTIMQHFQKEVPGSFALVQHLSMAGLICAGLLNIRFGVEAKHYILALFTTFMGGIMGFLQMWLSVPTGGPGIAPRVAQFNFNTLALFTFAIVIAGILLVLFIRDFFFKYTKNLEMSVFANFCFLVGCVVMIANLGYFLVFHTQMN